MLGAQARHDLEPLGERRGLGPVVRLEVADHDVAALGLRLPPFLEHPVRLADAGRHPEQDPVVPRTRTSRPRALYAPKRLWTIRSISLMPMNGRIMPPSP